MDRLLFACLLGLFVLLVASDPSIGTCCPTCSTEACRPQDSSEADEIVMLSTGRKLGKRISVPQRSAAGPSEKVTLQTVVGKWSSSDGSAKRIEIKADGIVHYDQQHWKEFDLFENGGVVMKNDGWKVDTTKSNANKLVWSKGGKDDIAWSRTEAPHIPASESAAKGLPLATRLFGSAQPQLAVSAEVNKELHNEASSEDQQSLVEAIARPEATWAFWILVCLYFFGPVVLLIVSLADEKRKRDRAVKLTKGVAYNVTLGDQLCSLDKLEETHGDVDGANAFLGGARVGAGIKLPTSVDRRLSDRGEVLRGTIPIACRHQPAQSLGSFVQRHLQHCAA